MIYNDYTNINATLVKDFKIDLVYINRIMQELKNNIKVKVEKYDLNVDCINNLNGGKLKFIDINSFEEFIREVSLRIAKELE